LEICYWKALYLEKFSYICERYMATKLISISLGRVYEWGENTMNLPM
jgi:hypothetical protein